MPESDPPKIDPIARATQLLAEEMEASHSAFVRLQRAAEHSEWTDTYYRGNWRIAARLMSAQAVAANTLKRLADRRERFTFTYIHQGPPSRQKLKTTVPVQPVLNSTAGEKAESEKAENAEADVGS
jgi:hypothetical protein